MAINISNANNRDAVVAVEGLIAKREVRYVDKNGAPTSNARILKADAEHELAVIQKKHKTLDKVAKVIVKDDPEVNIENAGMFLVDTSKVYVSQSGILHLVDEFGNRWRREEVDTFFQECLDRGSDLATGSRGEQQLDGLFGEIRVLLGARKAEFRADRLLVEQEPGMVATGRQHVPERPQAVETREQRGR